ncbi:hypothetical protein PVA44_07720 (plasmid) [Entomospira nematocerorum]|uniref:Uncharacterized protein n=1 Tax=Entomospira nematocerorum TaxID=2719987 RepID=A0A968GGG2_9SPIO|nr:hypothetical protein [Entomospira nematocera]NIZ47800.1 hypothetical protein [Entomospira nematocera]WDI34778.1 hypothetical protein PVA44_07720 [Entomospira nematocera]
MAKKPHQEESIDEELSDLLATDEPSEITFGEEMQHHDASPQETSTKAEEQTSSSNAVPHSPVHTAYRLTSAMSLYGTLYHIGDMIEIAPIDDAVLHDLLRRGVVQPVEQSND